MSQSCLVPSSAGPSRTRVLIDEQTPPLRLGDSPAQRLPGELVLRIVELGSAGPGSGRPGDFAIHASHICAGWRAFIIGDPSLWAYVRIHNIILPELNLACASTFLQRSKKLPITVSIETKPGYVDGERLNVPGAIAELIAPHMHRVQEYNLTYSERYGVGDVMGMIPRSRAPLLETFSIQRSLDTPLEGTSLKIPLILPCLQGPAADGTNWRESIQLLPTLRDLRFSGATPNWVMFSPRNLRSLVLQDLEPSAPNWVQLRKVLHASASTLTVLAITNSFPSNFPDSSTCELPVLESLTLGDGNPFSVDKFTALVSVPSLTELALLDTRPSHLSEPNHGLSQAVSLANMMQRLPLHQIRTLRLSHLVFLRTAWPHGGPATAADCEAAPRALFSQLPQLQRLTLVHPDVYTVHALARPPHLMRSTGYPVHPMPLLSHLALECVDERMFMFTLNILHKRITVGPAAPQVRRLEELTVSLRSGGQRQLDSQGFRVFPENVADKVIYKDMDDICPVPPDDDSLQFFY